MLEQEAVVLAISGKIAICLLEANAGDCPTVELPTGMACSLKAQERPLPRKHVLSGELSQNTALPNSSTTSIRQAEFDLDLTVPGGLH